MSADKTSKVAGALAPNRMPAPLEPTANVGSEVVNASVHGDRSAASNKKPIARIGAAATEDPLLRLTEALETGIDECLQETRHVLRQWVRDTISQAAGRKLVVESGAHKKRVQRVMRAVGLRSSRSADLLLYLTDEPDVLHDYAALATVMTLVKGVGTDGDMLPSTRNLIRVRISDLRARLRQLGLDKVIQNQNRRGYMVSAADAAHIRMLWKATDPS